jgi:hypothetical protein
MIMALRASMASGVVGFDARVERRLISSSSSDGACSTCSKKTSPGSGRARVAMRSVSPDSMNSSTRRLTRARVSSSCCATTAGVK